MSDGFKFADLLKPGEGARMALENHVNLKAPLPEHAGEVYRGPWDLMARHGVYQPGRMLPDHYRHLQGPPNQCHGNALDVCLQDRTLRYFTGFYSVWEHPVHHSWAVAPDGGVVEVTFETDPSREPNRIVPNGGPWVPVESWWYIGVEYDIDFISSFHFDHDGSLPVFEPDPRVEPEVPPLQFNHPYRKEGFPI